jgi:hypothetical protein
MPMQKRANKKCQKPPKKENKKWKKEKPSYPNPP